MDKRTTSRQRTFISALISFNEQRSSMSCVIRNLSKSGARLAVDSAHTLPSTFKMDLPERGREYWARVVWLSPDAMGVKFVSAPSA